MGNRESIIRSLNFANVDNNQSQSLKTTNLPIIFILGGPGAGKGEPHPVGYNRQGEAIISRYWLPQDCRPIGLVGYIPVLGIQCEKIAKKYGVVHLSSGDLLKEEIAAHTPRGIMIDQLMAENKPLPINILLDLIKEKMTNPASTVTGFILDGFPRDKIQSKLFEKEVGRADLIIYLKVDEKVIKESLQGRAVTSGRKEDTDDNLRMRVKLIMQKNNSLLKYYNKRVHVIDADRDIEEVFTDICSLMDSMEIFSKCNKME